MPQTHPHHTEPAPDRPRVALLLVASHRSDGAAVPAGPQENWHGIDPRRLAWLINHYTKAGDLVLDRHHHPAVTRAADFLSRRTAPPVPGGNDPASDVSPVHGAALVLAGLSRCDTNGVPALTEAMRSWHRLLRPGGFLLTVLPPAGTQPRRTSLRTTVITAARTAGLRYHQHLPVVLVALPDDEPRTRAASPAPIAPALLDGRHLPVHLDVLTFAASTLNDEETPHA